VYEDAGSSALWQGENALPALYGRLLAAVLHQRGYPETTEAWAKSLHDIPKIERRGRVNVPVINDGKLSFPNNLSDFTLFGKHL